MRCIRCTETIAPAGPGAAISVAVAGDEYIYSWARCARCAVFTVEVFIDRFMGDSEIHYLPPIDEAEGQRALALIRACPEPHDKHCGCASHRALSTGRPG